MVSFEVKTTRDKAIAKLVYGEDIQFWKRNSTAMKDLIILVACENEVTFKTALEYILIAQTKQRLLHKDKDKVLASQDGSNKLTNYELEVLVGQDSET